ncbi:predicted protein [Nematostella vectensis]|uniref:Small ribosomal subunit protein uS17 n=2 Tax=Nematostella vectensis TaxID=45351 RepID=A7RL80_NEMVE|nr:predicted protein [Nematostella vectensis]|eukprot:XP_001639879.1 predicted protein [Nematostella vectensis]
MAEQTERAYQKQAPIFQNRKRVLGQVTKKKDLRFVRNVGLGFKTPKDAIEGTYIDKKCPFTGNVSIRGRILTGICRSMKMKRTIIIRRDYLHYIKKYNRFEKRHKNLAAHCSPCFRDIALGDLITVGQCRPLSKTVRFNVLKVSKGKSTMKGKKEFEKF